MECQSTKYKINLSKKLPKYILLVVEGSEEEFYFLKHIFEVILHLSVTTQKKSGGIERIKLENSSSTVIMVNTRSSNIKTIEEREIYEDRINRILKEEKGGSIFNYPLYFIFDRDRESNDLSDIENLMDIYTNSRENGYNLNGLLLLSYPSIESYELSHFDAQAFKHTIKDGKSAKKEVKKYSKKKINQTTLLRAFKSMIEVMKEYNISSFDIDNFRFTNKKILRKEEEFYKTYKEYRILSLVSILFLDLGLIETKA